MPEPIFSSMSRMVDIDEPTPFWLRIMPIPLIRLWIRYLDFILARPTLRVLSGWVRRAFLVALLTAGILFVAIETGSSGVVLTATACAGFGLGLVMNYCFPALGRSLDFQTVEMDTPRYRDIETLTKTTASKAGVEAPEVLLADDDEGNYIVRLRKRKAMLHLDRDFFSRSEKEQVATIAHEIGHLKSRLPVSNYLSLGILLPIACGSFLLASLVSLALAAIAFALTISIGWLFKLWMRRRGEYLADTIAYSLAQEEIILLLKGFALEAERHTPRSQIVSWLDTLGSTHPTPKNRLRALGYA